MWRWLVCCVALAFVSGCSSSVPSTPSTHVGQWGLTHTPDFPYKVTMDVNADGTFTMLVGPTAHSESPETIRGVWEKDVYGQVALREPGTEPPAFVTLLGNEWIILDMEGEEPPTLVFERLPRQADTTPAVVVLLDEKAVAATKGISQRGAFYIDIMPDGSLVLDDSDVTDKKLKGGMKKYIAQGQDIATLRVAEGTSSERLNFVYRAARDTRLRVLEIVRIPATDSQRDTGS